MDKREAAEEVAGYLREAARMINRAIDLMERHGLSLENYPEYWHDFVEHPTELTNTIITDFEDIHLGVDEAA